ncbi:MAG: PEP-utilizing enzyme, partial [Verrucomicrobia bacterium]|nr:PEP-utilizing enzyme [Verrucomicrobiota bacterium]
MPVSAKPQSGTRVRLQGLGVSPGVVVAPVFRMFRQSEYVPEYSISEKNLHTEIRRLERAIIETRRQIKGILKDLKSQTVMAEVGILDAHLMVLDDHAYIGEIVNGIRTDHLNAEFLVKCVTDQYVKAFSALKDSYFSERVVDVKDVAHRLIRNLVGDDVAPIHHQTSELIAVSEDLTPSETALFRREIVRGIATDFGSITSHTALLAKALRIPAVVGLQTASQIAQTGMQVLIDGTRGVMILNPTAKDRASFGRFEDERLSIVLELKELQDKPAETTDAHRIVLSANIESIDEITAVFDCGAEGVGLFRSEYLYISSERPQTEDEQTKIYTAAAMRLGELPFIVRTYDLGGDKYAEDVPMHREANPFL